MHDLAGKGKPGPPPPRRYPCGWCGGDGYVLLDPHDPRKGHRSCPRCHGRGEV